MDKVKFNITVPQKGENWKIDTINGHSQRKSPTLVMRLLERKLNAISVRGNETKTCVKVKYDAEYYNESPNVLLTPDSLKQTLWVTSCFLEDHLSKRTLKRFENNYFESR